MENVFVLSLVMVFTLSILIIAAASLLLACIAATLKGIVVMPGFIVTFPTGNKRWVQNPQRYQREGYAVEAENVSINIADLKESVHGVYMADAWNPTNKEPTTDTVVQLMFLGNMARKKGFVKTLFTM